MVRAALTLAVVALLFVSAAPAAAESRCEPVLRGRSYISFKNVVGMSCARARAVARRVVRCSEVPCTVRGMRCRQIATTEDAPGPPRPWDCSGRGGRKLAFVYDPNLGDE